MIIAMVCLGIFVLTASFVEDLFEKHDVSGMYKNFLRNLRKKGTNAKR